MPDFPELKRKKTLLQWGSLFPDYQDFCVSVEFKPFEIASLSELDTYMDTSIDTLVDDIEEDPDFVQAEDDMPVKKDFVITESTTANESPCFDYEFIIFWSKLLLDPGFTREGPM